MTTLYYAPGACSLAAHIVLEEAGAPYDTVRLDLAAGRPARAGIPRGQRARPGAGPGDG